MPIMDGMAKLRQWYIIVVWPLEGLVGRVAGSITEMGDAVFKVQMNVNYLIRFAETVEGTNREEQQYINSVWDRILKED